MCSSDLDNPFMAGAFHGVGEADAVVSVGVSGPGVVYHALQSVKGRPLSLIHISQSQYYPEAELGSEI